MKKLVLIAFAVIAGLYANAQQADNIQKAVVNRNTRHFSTSEGVPASWKSAPAPVHPKNMAKRTGRAKSGTVDSINIGNQSNAFGWIDGSRQLIWADPRLNAVAIIHRAALGVTTWDGYTGVLRYDYSMDGGNTFAINQGPMYAPTSEPNYPDSTDLFPVARYPQGGIYNPPGNTNPQEAYITYYAACLDNTNPDLAEANTSQYWGGHVHGTIFTGDTTQQTQVHDITSFADSVSAQFVKIIPEGFTMDMAGHAWSIDAATNEATGFGWANGNGVYTGNLIISKGTFNTTTHGMDYTHSLLPVPVYVVPGTPDTPLFADCNIAFSPNGNVGYVVALGNNTYPADSSDYPIVYKTMDGGATWVGPAYIVLDSIGALMPNQSQNGKYFAAYSGIDAIVDINDNLHINLAVFDDYSPGGAITPGYWGYFDIYTVNGGNTWKAHLLANPETLEGEFSPSTTDAVDEYSRAQASSTIWGDHLFFSWFDTDTAQFGSTNGNANPDLHSIGYNVATQTWTPDSNFTNNASNTQTPIGGLITFGTCSQWVFTPSAGVYNIPAAFQTIPNGTASTTQLEYITNVDFTDADFTLPTDTTATDPNFNTVNLYAATPLGIQNVSSNNFYLNTYPNPATNFVSVNYQLSKAVPVTIEILNILGDNVSTPVTTQTLGAGIHSNMLDVSKLSNGIYMIRTTLGDQVVISKLTKI